MKLMRSIPVLLVGAALLLGGCTKDTKYGREKQLTLPAPARQVWAVAPAINLSGEKVDPILQADIVFEQLQSVHNLTVIPVNRVAEVYTMLRFDKVESQEQAALVCDLLGCDALVVPTVTMYDPYNPPKLGASVQVFVRNGNYARPQNLDVRELSRAATPQENQSVPPPSTDFLQAVGMFDAADGSVRAALFDYAKGRNDPTGPLGAREYLENMDRYCGFAYYSLISDLLRSPQLNRT